MSEVTNQLEGIRVPTIHYPRVEKIAPKIALPILLTGYAALGGALINLGTVSTEVLTGALIGGTVGLVISLAIVFFSTFSTKIEHYRVEVLNKIRPALSDPKALEALETLKKNYFPYPLKRFSPLHQHHTLHTLLCRISDHIDRKKQEAMQTWVNFLKHLHGMQLENGILRMGFDRSIALKPPEEYVSIFDLTKMVQHQIEELQKLGLEKGRSDGKVLYIRTSQSEVLGYIRYIEKEKGIEITELVRKPEAARMGIGATLLCSVLRRYKNEPVVLSIAKDNPAILLFKKFQFEKERDLENNQIEMGISTQS